MLGRGELVTSNWLFTMFSLAFTDFVNSKFFKRFKPQSFISYMHDVKVTVENMVVFDTMFGEACGMFKFVNCNCN